MKHLVVAVSPDSSLELLGEYADILVLDKEPAPDTIPFYESLYIRSHFGQPSTLPQVFRKEIEHIVQQAKITNPNIKFIDATDTVEKILATEDKWQQYERFSTFMPKTQLLNEKADTASFVHPVFKNRLSSRGNGVTWDIEQVTGLREDWLIQESIDIIEELRVYVIHGKVYPVGAIRQSKSLVQNTQAVDYRELKDEEIEFSSKVADKAPNLDIIGLDIARASDNKLYLMEANRSPGFGVFNKLTGINLASFLYGEASIPDFI